MDIGKAFTDAWNAYFRNFIIILLAAIVALLLGILIAPLVGFQMMFVKASRGENISFNDVFAPFSHFLSLCGAVILMTLMIMVLFAPGVICFFLGWNAVGGILMFAAALAAIYLGICWMFALILVVDKNLKAMAAIKASREMVLKNNWWLHLLLAILSGIVGSLGQFLLGFGVILTMPLGTGAVASAYANESK